MNDNLASVVSRAELGEHYHPFAPSYDYFGEFVDSAHATLAASGAQQELLQYQEVDGFLRVADALKLYELAYFAAGDVLETGTHHGLSAAVITSAILGSLQPDRQLHTVELSPVSMQIARAHHERLGIEDSISYYAQPSELALAGFVAAGKRFAFMFVDHDHSYHATQALLHRLPDLLTPTAFVLFHDYNDPRNADSDDVEYGVFDAIANDAPEALTPYGSFGCCGLFRYNAEAT